MRRRVDAAVERHRALGAEVLADRVERTAAGEAEDEVEARVAVVRQVLHVLSACEPVEGNRGVEVVEDAQEVALGGDEVGRDDGVGAVRGDDAGIRLAQLPFGALRDLIPLAIEDEVVAVSLVKVAGVGVVRDIVLEENGAMTHRAEGPQERPPDRGVTVPP